MATVAFTSAFDIANFWAARSGAAILTGATEYRFQNAAGLFIKVTGTGLTYTGDDPLAGNYTAITVYSDAGFVTQVASYSSSSDIAFATYFSSNATTALAGIDSITGSASGDTLSGGGGADTLAGGDGSDEYEFGANDVVSGEVINDTGTTGTDTLVVANSADFRLATIAGIEAVRFLPNPLTATFNAAQLPANFTVTGANGAQTLAITNATNFSAAAWTFNNWEVVDLVTIAGTTGADLITGGNGAGGNLITGGDGIDQLIGGSAPDNFRYNAGVDIEAGETIAGGTGSDVIQVNCDGSSYDFSGATISGIEGIFLNFGAAGGSATVTLSGSQLRAGSIGEVLDSTSFTNSLIVAGASVDLSGVAFSNWTNGVDSLRINGTNGIDGLIGSDQRDTITGGRGKDTLTGDLNADTFDFNLRGETQKGAINRDVITDFSGVAGGVGELDLIDLSTIDARVGIAGNQTFKFIGAQKFHDKKGELHVLNKGGFFLVEGDVNGDGRADFQIEVHSAVALVNADFVL